MEPDVDGSGPLLRGLCRLAHHIGEAEFTAIYVKKETGGVRVLASAGMALGPLSEKWRVPVNPDNQPVVSVPDITREPLFADHPVHSLPGLKSVMMFPFRAPAPAGFGGLGLANMRKRSFGNFRVSCALSQISWLSAIVLQSNPGKAAADNAEGHVRAGFQETGEVRGHRRELEPAGQFLFSTLVKRPAVRSRNGVGYVIVRSWRTVIKQHQVLALRAVKPIHRRRLSASSARNWRRRSAAFLAKAASPMSCRCPAATRVATSVFQRGYRRTWPPASVRATSQL